MGFFFSLQRKVTWNSRVHPIDDPYFGYTTLLSAYHREAFVLEKEPCLSST